MPIELNSFIKEPDGDRILVRHSFYGKDKAEAKMWKKRHLASCEYFRAAEKEDRVIDIAIEVDELPEFDEDELESFLDLEDEGEDEEEELGPEEDE